MAPLAVVKYLNILTDRGFSLDSGSVATMVHKFISQASPKAFHWGVIITVAPA
jgi:hypothetical protein